LQFSTPLNYYVLHIAVGKNEIHAHQKQVLKYINAEISISFT